MHRFYRVGNQRGPLTGVVEYPVDVALVVEIKTDVKHFEVISLRGIGKPRLRHVGWTRIGLRSRTRSSSLSMAVVVVLAPKDREAPPMMTQNLLGPSMKELFEDDERRGPILEWKERSMNEPRVILE